MRSVEAIEQAALEAGFTRKQLCDAAGVDTDTVWRALTRRTSTTLATIEKLEAGLRDLIEEKAA